MVNHSSSCIKSTHYLMTLSSIYCGRLQLSHHQQDYVKSLCDCFTSKDLTQYSAKSSLVISHMTQIILISFQKNAGSVFSLDSNADARHQKFDGTSFLRHRYDACTKTKMKLQAFAYNFISFAVETLGALGKNAAAFLRDLGARIIMVSKERYSIGFLMQRVSPARKRCLHSWCV